MSISLKKKSITIDEQEKYVLRNVECDPMEYEEFVDELSAESTVTRHDVKGVVSALQEWVVRYLKAGYSVRLGDLGSFHVTLKSTGQASEDAVTADTITAVRVQFTPSSMMEEAFALGAAQDVKLVTLTD